MWKKWRSLREFEALRAVIDTGATTTAARRLGISQSAVSRAIAQLEARMGCLLFDREAGRIHPTAEALALNENLDKLFAALATIDGSEWRQPTARVLRIVSPPTIAHRFLARRLVSFLKTHPDLRVSFEVCASDVLVPGLLDERFDIGVMSASTSRSGLTSEPFLESEGVCIMPRQHPLAAVPVVRPEMLDDQPFISLSRRFDARLRFDQVFAAARAKPRALVEATTVDSVCEMVAAGLGLAVINPFPALAVPSPDIVIRPFEPTVTWQATFLYSSSRPLPAAARAFIRHVRMTMPKYPFARPLHSREPTGA